LVLAQQTTPVDNFSRQASACAMPVQRAPRLTLTPTHNLRSHANAEKKGTSSAAAEQK